MGTKTKTLSAAVLASGMLIGGTAGAEGASAEAISYTCAGCHGFMGNSTGPATPNLAGASSEYIVEMMKQYRDGEAASTIMGRIAKGYSDEQYALMGEFFSKQKRVVPQQEHDAALAKTGAKLHDKYCEKCHAEGGTSAEDDSGILAGQWKPYLEFTLADFTAGSREMPKKMAKKVKQLNEKEGDAGLEALLNFYASAK
jgi:cytochrome subunit of sulfide dehydrogenase